jgi:putative transposase
VHDILVLFVHVIVTLLRLSTPGGFRSVVGESAMLRHQLLILNRGRKRAPNLRVSDRIIAGLCTLLMRPARMLRSAIVLKPSTLLHFHQMLIKRKYRTLFSAKRKRRAGPKGPDKELVDVVVEMKQRNPTWGCRRIAQQIFPRVRRQHRQRRCAQNSCRAFSAQDRFIRSVLAYLP